MGTSHPETKPFIIELIREHGVSTILDIGAGSGTYADALRDAGWQGTIDAVEVWQPYIDEFDLASKYRTVYAMDARDFHSFDYDLVIFGDVLEHMPESDAVGLWECVSRQAKHGVIAIPIIHYHQPAINGNPYEEHITEDWTPEKVIDVFPGIGAMFVGSITGAFWADFN